MRIFGQVLEYIEMLCLCNMENVYAVRDIDRKLLTHDHATIEFHDQTKIDFNLARLSAFAYNIGIGIQIMFEFGFYVENFTKYVFQYFLATTPRPPQKKNN